MVKGVKGRQKGVVEGRSVGARWQVEVKLRLVAEAGGGGVVPGLVGHGGWRLRAGW
jgi:hypothetical protein